MRAVSAIESSGAVDCDGCPEGLADMQIEAPQICPGLAATRDGGSKTVGPYLRIRNTTIFYYVYDAIVFYGDDTSRNIEDEILKPKGFA